MNNDERMEEVANSLKAIKVNNILDLIDCTSLVIPVLGFDDIGNFYKTKINFDNALLVGKNIESIYAGKIDERLEKLCKEKKIKLYSYLDDPIFNYENSKLTVLGFIKTLLNDLEYSLYYYKIVIMGYGYLGNLLAQSFKGLNVDYSIFAPKNTKEIVINNEKNADNIIDYDIIINTIPINIIKEEEYELLKDKLIYDLASYPYGFNPIIIKTKQLGGIPGKIYPKEAGQAIANFIKTFL